MNTKAKPTNAAMSILNGELPLDVTISAGASWNDVINRMENPIHDALYNTAALGRDVQDAVKLAGIDDDEFQSRMTGLLRLLSEYSSILSDIRERRAGRTGRTTDSSDYTEYVAISALATGILEEMSANLQDGLLNLTEYHSRALAILEAAQKQTQETAAANGAAPDDAVVSSPSDQPAEETTKVQQ